MPDSVTLRPGRMDDSYALFVIFEQTLADLIRRFGSTEATSLSNPEALAKMWDQRRPLFEHLAENAAQFWIAERGGQPIGFARSIVEDGLQQLTELFVLPEGQSSGLGRELIGRAFPVDGTRSRSIISTPDFRAQALYLKAGVYPRFLIYYFGRDPESVRVETDLEIVPIRSSSENLATLATIDRQVLDHSRDTTHRWLLSDRQGYLYLRDGQAVGYGYTGVTNGPFALLDDADFPTVLAHAENDAAAHGREFGVEVPMVNQAAVQYLLSRHFWIDSFMTVLMSDRAFGNFENYILTSPPFFL